MKENHVANKEVLVNELLHYFISEVKPLWKGTIPQAYEEKRLLLRGIINQRNPVPIDKEILEKEAILLQLELQEKPITDANCFDDPIVIWKGDITTLRCDAIVNASNEYVLGCFSPNHFCIDNQIHTYAGIRLRLACHEIMKGKTLKNGGVILTEGYQLPCRYIIHTVGPQIDGVPSEKDCQELRDCYLNSLILAAKNNLKTIAFPCISTGIFSFPKEQAASIAYDTVSCYIKDHPNVFSHIIFNVFTEGDRLYYDRLYQSKKSD